MNKIMHRRWPEPSQKTPKCLAPGPAARVGRNHYRECLRDGEMERKRSRAIRALQGEVELEM